VAVGTNRDPPTEEKDRRDEGREGRGKGSGVRSIYPSMYPQDKKDRDCISRVSEFLFSITSIHSFIHSFIRIPTKFEESPKVGGLKILARGEVKARRALASALLIPLILSYPRAFTPCTRNTTYTISSFFP